MYKSRIIGVLFLAAFLAYGLGQHLLGSTDSFEKYTGALLIVINSIIVFSIGILLQKTLIQYNVLVGNIYFFTRTLEAILLASIVLPLLPVVEISHDYIYFVAMLTLGLGSIPMCVTLYTNHLSPPWLAIWGIVGYVTFSLGFFMEILGIVASMYLLPLGGLWEVTFAIWLIIQGSRGKNNHAHKLTHD